MPRPRTIFVLSDSTGDTADKVVRAALMQFPDSGVRIRLFGRVIDAAHAREVLERAQREGALVVFTVVAPEVRRHLHEAAYDLKIECVDLIGALMGKLAAFLNQEPLGKPGALLHPRSEEYFRRIDAMEFAVKCDDGKEPENLKKADVVLVGLSRTGKTPLANYLAHRALKVANLPIVAGVPLPPALAEVPPGRVFGLRVALEHLHEVRRSRVSQIGLEPNASYASREHIRQELEYAESIFRQNPGWTVIDITGKAIEEAAAVILELLEERRNPDA
jgi:hypothetical protein